jgi:tetratricopeptide (TPR) repeat protein
MANAYYQLGEVEEAIFNYHKSINLNPKKVECYYNLGNAHCHRGELKEAIQFYLKTISLDAMHDPALFNLVYTYYQLKDYE